MGQLATGTPATMPGGSGGKSCTNAGTNNSGNSYRAYSDGGYSYSNKGSSGNTTSSYYNTGSGHSFYSSKSGGYNCHTNHNTGTSTYSSNAKNRTSWQLNFEYSLF